MSGTGKDQTIMKVSEFLKKVGTIEQAEIWIEFKENKKDTNPELERLTGNTPEEQADQVIKRASGYAIQEVNLNENVVIITAVKIERRKPKPEKPGSVAEQKQADGEELKQEIRELEQEIRKMVECLFTPIYEAIIGFVDNTGQKAEKAGKKTKTVIGKARAAVARLLKKIFRRGV